MTPDEHYKAAESAHRASHEYLDDGWDAGAEERTRVAQVHTMLALAGYTRAGRAAGASTTAPWNQPLPTGGAS